VQGLYIVDPPTVTPLHQYDQSVNAYKEVAAIHVCTVDSTDVTGTVLLDKMSKELRYVAENAQTGSMYLQDREEDASRSLGSMKLYDTKYYVEYRRLKG
jgi:hypothetical protein